MLSDHLPPPAGAQPAPEQASPCSTAEHAATQPVPARCPSRVPCQPPPWRCQGRNRAGPDAAQAQLGSSQNICELPAAWATALTHSTTEAATKKTTPSWPEPAAGPPGEGATFPTTPSPTGPAVDEMGPQVPPAAWLQKLLSCTAASLPSEASHIFLLQHFLAAPLNPMAPASPTTHCVKNQHVLCTSPDQQHTLAAVPCRTCSQSSASPSFAVFKALCSVPA